MWCVQTLWGSWVWMALCAPGSKVKELWLPLLCAHVLRHWSGFPLAEAQNLLREKKKPKQSLFKRGLNYANPIIVINCWENSALIAPKQWAQLYTALMWILGNQLVHFHMKELILCLEGEMEEVAVSFWQKPLRVFCTNLHKRLSSFNFTGSTTM